MNPRRRRHARRRRRLARLLSRVRVYDPSQIEIAVTDATGNTLTFRGRGLAIDYRRAPENRQIIGRTHGTYQPRRES